jgi:hypothetical protein
MTHSELVRAIQLECSQGDVRLFINNTGQWQDGVGNWIRYGLCVGSSDLIGWRTIFRIAQFVALEVKTGKGRLTKEQMSFGEQVERMGGVFACVRSVDDAKRALGLDCQQA